MTVNDDAQFCHHAVIEIFCHVYGHSCMGDSQWNTSKMTTGTLLLICLAVSDQEPLPWNATSKKLKLSS
jgi:hypothetical protein